MFTNTVLYIYHKFPYRLSKTGETCALASKYGEIFVKKKDEYSQYLLASLFLY